MRAWLELARLSNAPTVVTNVLTGCALAGAVRWPVAGAMSVAVILLYVAGMALNDVADEKADRRERPGRPIPSGRISWRAAVVFAVACAGGGVAVAGFHGIAALAWALGLAAAIVAYDLLHARTAASVLLMGLCRALIYPLAATAAGGALGVATLALAVTLGVYVVALTVIARVEMEGGRRRRFALAGVLPVVIFAPLLAVRPEAWPLPLAAGGLAALWIVRSSAHLLASPPRIGRAVTGWLAGICLADAFWLLLLDAPVAAAVAAACFVVTVIAQRFVAGS